DLSLDQGRGDIVTVPRRALAAVARAHTIAAIIEDAAHEQSLRACPSRSVATALLGELSLNSLEQIPIKDRGMICAADLALEVDRADVEAVAQEISERPSGEGDAANGPSI